MGARPQYESSRDRDNEAAIAAEVASRFRAGYRKIPKSYVLDFAVTRNGKITGFMECKRRYNAMNKYPTIFVAMHKVDKAESFLACTGLKSIFAIQWDDQLGYILLDEPDFLEIGGRFDRGDEADQEPMAHYSIERVRFL